jgi:hypothetical protein
MHLTDGKQYSGNYQNDPEADNNLVVKAIETLRADTREVLFDKKRLPSSVLVDLFLQVGKDSAATEWLAKIDDELEGVDVISQFLVELVSDALPPL